MFLNPSFGVLKTFDSFSLLDASSSMPFGGMGDGSKVKLLPEFGGVRWSECRANGVDRFWGVDLIVFQVSNMGLEFTRL